MSHPTPPADIGLTWRAPIKGDAQALAAHTRKIHEAETLESLAGPEFFEWLFDQTGIDPETDALVAVQEDDIVADAGTWLHTADTGARCIIWAETSPGFEDLRTYLLDWAVTRATERLSYLSNGAPRVIRISVEEHRRRYRDAIEAAGFGSMRSFAVMARSLTDLPQPGPLPAGIDIIPWSDDLEESTRIASNESFSDHWGSLAMTTEEFSGFYRTNPTFRPDLSHLALAGGRVVSFCLCEVDDEDNAERDTNDLFIQRVGTIQGHRGQGLAAHLIVRSMQAAAEAGSLDRAALDVDEMSHTNATAVYERLGFEIYDRSLHYTITL